MSSELLAVFRLLLMEEEEEEEEGQTYRQTDREEEEFVGFQFQCQTSSSCHFSLSAALTLHSFVSCLRTHFFLLFVLRLFMCLWAPVCRTCRTAGSGCRSPEADGRRPSSAGGRGTSPYPWLPGETGREDTAVRVISYTWTPPEGDTHQHSTGATPSQ